MVERRVYGGNGGGEGVVVMMAASRYSKHTVTEGPVSSHCSHILEC